MNKLIYLDKQFYEGIVFMKSHELIKSQKTFKRITKLKRSHAEAVALNFFQSEKSLTLENLLPQFHMNEIEFVNLQYGDVSNQVEEFKNNYIFI